MNSKCKCKNPNEYSVIEGIGIRCEKCLKWMSRCRENFYKQTQVKKNKKIYNRKKSKRKRLKEE